MITLSPITPADLDEVLAIDHRAFSDAFSREAYEDILSYQTCRTAAAWANGTLLGFAVVQNSERFPGTVNLLSIAVDEPYRRTGVGRQLLTWAIEQARAFYADQLCLKVRVSNAPAQALYRSAGFQDGPVLANFYENPVEDAMSMGLPLT